MKRLIHIISLPPLLAIDCCCPTINGTVLADGHFGGTIGFNQVGGVETRFQISDRAWKTDLRGINE